MSSRFTHLEPDILALSSWQNCSSSVRLDGECRWTGTSSLAVNSQSDWRLTQVLGFRRLQHSFGRMLRVIILLDGEPALQSFTDWNRFSFRITLDLALSVLSWNLTSPCWWNHASWFYHCVFYCVDGVFQEMSSVPSKLTVPSNHVQSLLMILFQRRQIKTPMCIKFSLLVQSSQLLFLFRRVWPIGLS